MDWDDRTACQLSSSSNRILSLTTQYMRRNPSLQETRADHDDQPRSLAVKSSCSAEDARAGVHEHDSEYDLAPGMAAAKWD
jgi:hypothetical protein